MKSKVQIANILSVLVILAMLIAPVSTVSFAAGPEKAQGPEGDTPAASTEQSGKNGALTGLYIIRLQDASLASYTGGIQGLEATSPLVTGSRYVDTQSSASRAYLNYLESQQTQLLSAIQQALGRSIEVRHQYLNVLNGMAVAINSGEAAIVSKLPGVVSVVPDTLRELDTEVSVEHIGAFDIWGGYTLGNVGTQGEGVIVGVIDSGINHDHPSFAEVGGDGYIYTSPYGENTPAPGSYCDTTDPTFCNDKLIGAYDLNPAVNPNDPEDDDGHGSHTASTAAGNVISATITVGTDSYTVTLNGVAPHAYVIAYKVCEPGCPSSSSVAAVDQAITDRANAGGLPMVLNYSISGSDNPWNDSVDLAFLDAFNAGIFVSASAGNDGPGASTAAKTGGWNMSVGATTIDRIIANSFDVTGPPTVPSELQGLGAIVGTGPAIVSDIENDIIWADDVSPGNGIGCSAFPAGVFDDAIALIQRGACSFATKVNNATAAGAVAVVVFNNVGGPPITMGGLEATIIPAVFLDIVDGTAVKDWASANIGTATARINAGSAYIRNDSWEDIVAGFSSRGPSRYNTLKPDIAAPGVNILAASAVSSEFAFLQGTSMASPHGAGSAALLSALHPNWSPAEIKSALQLTALTNPVPLDGATANVFKENGLDAANWFDMGSGRVNLTTAGYAGLVMDESYDNFVNANPDTGGDPRTLNLPGMQDNGCFNVCSWTRTVSSTVGVTTTWAITYEVPTGVSLSVSPMGFTLAPYGTQTFTVTADVSEAPVEVWAFAQVYLWETSLNVDLSLDKTDGGITSEPGATVPYTITYANNGTADTTGVVLYDTVPANTSFNAAASSAGWVLVSGDTYMYDIGSLVAGDGGSVVFAVDVDDPFPEGVDTITNTATLEDDASNSAEAADTTLVMQPPIEEMPTLYLPLIFNNSSALSESTEASSAEGAAHTPTAPNIGLLSGVHLPVAVYPVKCGGVPNLLNFTVYATSGSEDLLLCEAALEVTDFTSVLSGLAEGTVYTDTLSQDPTNGDPYDNINDGTVTVVTATVSSAARFVAEVVASEAPDIDLYIGTGSTPSAATEVCSSTTGSYIEYCNIDDPADGTWWVLVQNWNESGSPPDAVTFVVGVVPDSDAGNWSVTGPNIAAGDPLSITVGWNEPTFESGDYWYGDFTVGTDPGSPDNLAKVNVNFEVLEPNPVIDVAPTILVSTQYTDTVMTQTLDVGNIGGGVLDWTIDEASSAAPLLPIVTPRYPASASPPLGSFTGFSANPSSTGVVSNPTRVATPEGGTTITHSASQTIVPGNSVSCNNGVGHADNSYVRRFTLMDFGITGAFDVQSVDIGIEVATGLGGDQPMEVRLYTWNPGDPFTWANFTLIGSAATVVTDQSGTILNIPVTGTVAAGGTLVVEIFTPDGQVEGNLLWVGSNSAGQTDASFIAAAACGLSEPTDLAAIGFPDMHIVMNVTGTEAAGGTCAAPSDIPWLSASPTSGSNAGGTSTAVDVTFDSTGLSTGVYTGTLCVNSNDPVTPLVEVPVELRVIGSSVAWIDNFDSYLTGQDLQGVGGWKGWDNDPTWTAFTTDVQALSFPNSVDIVADADLVHEYFGYTSGQWTYTAWQYIPSSMSGLTYFIMLNTYNDGGAKDWTVQVNFDGATNMITNDGVSGGTLTLIEDQWVEIRIEIDLDADTHTFYYDNQVLYTGSWTSEQGPGGVLNIGAVDLYANGASSVYYDDISLESGLNP